jgi:Skp family chaperone for outer membrane proteins
MLWLKNGRVNGETLGDISVDVRRSISSRSIGLNGNDELELTTTYLIREENNGKIKGTKNKYTRIPLKDNLISVDVLNQEGKTGGGVQGAAAGATVGFLVAGPVGTLLGAGMGRHKRGRESVTVSLAFASGDYLVIEMRPNELGEFTSWVAINNRSGQQTNSNIKDTNSSSAQSQSSEDKSKNKPKKLHKSLDIIKGRTNKKIDIVQTEILKDYEDKSKDFGEVGEFCYAVIFELAQDFNNFKWRTKDRTLSTKTEHAKIASIAISKISYIHQQIKSNKKRKNEIKSEIDASARNINILAKDNEVLSSKLQKWSLFGKTKLEAKINHNKTRLDEIKSAIEKAEIQQQKIETSLESNEPLSSSINVETTVKDYFKLIVPLKTTLIAWNNPSSNPLTKKVMEKIIK